MEELRALINNAINRIHEYEVTSAGRHGKLNEFMGGVLRNMDRFDRNHENHESRLDEHDVEINSNKIFRRAVIGFSMFFTMALLSLIGLVVAILTLVNK